jgi:hypothetical protein
VVLGVKLSEVKNIPDILFLERGKCETAIEG